LPIIDFWVRDDINILKTNIYIALVPRRMPDAGYRVSWVGAHNFLRNIYSGPKHFPTVAESKQYIDNWLMKMKDLKAFW
jgi:hypothetical protein